MIETTRLRIEPMTRDRVTATYVGWLNDPTVIRHSGQRGRVHSLESCQAYLDGFVGTPNRFWAILLKDGERHIGTATHHVDASDRSADIGILIGDTAIWGRGIGKEAWIALMEHGFTALGLERITGGCAVANTSMRRILLGAGMTPFDGGDPALLRCAAEREAWLATRSTH